MSETKNRSHLRLVSDNNILTAPNPEGMVSSLADYLHSATLEKIQLILVKEEDVLHNDDLARLLECLAPTYLFDFRISPRLDMLGPNRVVVFRFFDSMGISYVDMGGASPVGDTIFSTYLHELWRTQGENMDSKKSRAVIMLFDSQHALRSRANQLAAGFDSSSFSLSQFIPQPSELQVM